MLRIRFLPNFMTYYLSRLFFGKQHSLLQGRDSLPRSCKKRFLVKYRAFGKDEGAIR